MISKNPISAYLQVFKMSACPSNFSILSTAWRYTFGVLAVKVAAVALSGNMVVVILMLKIRSLRSRSNIILGSLAATDLLVGLFLAPMHILQFFSHTFRENCSFNAARRLSAVLLMGSSVASIALISYDRYVHLSKTQNYTQHMTPRKIGFFMSVLGCSSFYSFSSYCWKKRKVLRSCHFSLHYFDPCYYGCQLPENHKDRSREGKADGLAQK